MANFKFNETQREKVGDIIRDHDPYYNPVIDDYIDRIEQIVSERDGWIDVDDRLPDDGETVLAFSVSEKRHVRTYDNKRGWWGFENIEDVDITHWHSQPLPSPPKQPTK